MWRYASSFSGSSFTTRSYPARAFSRSPDTARIPASRYRDRVCPSSAASAFSSSARASGSLPFFTWTFAIS
jgi:hypothetical protein